MFKIEIPNIVEGIKIRANYTKRVEVKRYVERNQNILNGLWELRSRDASVDFRNRMIFETLPQLITSSIFIFIILGDSQVYESLALMSTATLFFSWRTKEKTESTWRGLIHDIIDKKIAELKRDGEDPSPICMNCSYGFFETRKDGTKIPTFCAVEPTYFNTGDAEFCKEYKSNTSLESSK
jgi:hypothetical protein